MFYAALKTLHLLSIIVWLGGMVFAHFFLRPAVAALEVPTRLRLMHEVLGRFFKAVLLASTLAVASGGWMVSLVARQTVQAGATFSIPVAWMVMALLGCVMLLVFGYIRLVLYPCLTRAVTAAAWPVGAAALAGIRQWVMVNLALGVLIVLVTLLGPAR